MQRFVLLYHECPPEFERPSHWDLMLEDGDILRTWALPRLPRDWLAAREQTAMSCPTCPPVAVGNSAAAEQLPDHRLDYLQQEGPIGGNRGSVHRIDAGTYLAASESLRLLELSLAGKLLHGRIVLRLSAAQWTLGCAPAVSST